jgi:hypothetical protein
VEARAAASPVGAAFRPALSSASSPQADVVVAVPVLGRPERVAPLIDSLDSSIETAQLRVIFVASPGDPAEVEALEQSGIDYLVAPFERGDGDWARKVNLVYRSTDAPWVFTGADDLCFCPGWADRALECAAATGAGVVGTQDYANSRVIAGEHATHNLVARWYADQHGTIDAAGQVVTEVYAHNFVDDELVETAKHRGLWTFCPDSEVPHNHPNWDRAIRRDRTYRIGEQQFDRDARLFRIRRAMIARS